MILVKGKWSTFCDYFCRHYVWFFLSRIDTNFPSAIEFLKLFSSELPPEELLHHFSALGNKQPFVFHSYLYFDSLCNMYMNAIAEKIVMMFDYRFDCVINTPIKYT